MDLPTITPKDSGRCGHHPRYEGKNPPRSACPVCWGLYLRLKHGMKIGEVLAPKTVALNNLDDAREFTKGLLKAVERTRTTGGLYSAFAHDREGRTFQVQIQVSLGREA